MQRPINAKTKEVFFEALLRLRQHVCCIKHSLVLLHFVI